MEMKRYSQVLALLVIAALVLVAPVGATFCYGFVCSPTVITRDCCQGNGLCLSSNNCSCVPGYEGNQCQYPNYCVMSGTTPVCTNNCTPWGSSATTERHGTCLTITPALQDTAYAETNDYSILLGSTLTYDRLNSRYVRMPLDNFCACAPGWAGTCCADYRPGTLTPPALDFGNVTVGAPDHSQPAIVLANTLPGTNVTPGMNLTIQSIALTGTDSSDFAYTTTCEQNTKMPPWPGTCSFAVTFTPSATGTRTALLSVSVSSDSGAHNQILNTTLTGTGITRVSSILVNPLDSANIFAGLSGAGIFRSTDSGSTWNTAQVLPANTQITALAKQPGTGSPALYAGTIGGGVYASTDNGQTWNACSNTGLANRNVLTLVSDSAGKLYAGTEAGVFASSDNCASWTAVNSGLTV